MYHEPIKDLAVCLNTVDHILIPIYWKIPVVSTRILWLVTSYFNNSDGFV